MGKRPSDHKKSQSDVWRRPPLKRGGVTLFFWSGRDYYKEQSDGSLQERERERERKKERERERTFRMKSSNSGLSGFQ